VVTFVDVTLVTRAEERQMLLLAELQHRVRNTLGVVHSIARRRRSICVRRQPRRLRSPNTS
jgi:two-component sensor histidine kinase